MEDGALQLLQFLPSRCNKYCLKGNFQEVGGKCPILNVIYSI